MIMFLAGISSWGRKVGRRLELLTISDRFYITIFIFMILLLIINIIIVLIITIVTITLSSLS